MKQRTLSFLGKAFFAGLMASLLSTQVMAQGSWTFRNGEGGYTGTIDTQIRQAGVQAGGGATDDSGLNPINSDNQDATTPGVVNALIRFNDIIGVNPGQIPPGTVIANATLVLRSTADNANSPGPVRAHRMVQDWPTTITFANSFNGDGIQADDIEASIAQDGADIIPNFVDPDGNPLNTRERTVDVTTTVQAWINGAVPNYGWVLINAANDGYRIDSAETAIITNRPTLRVVQSIDAPNCIDQPDSTTVVQCRTATFSTSWEGVPPIQYSWLYEVVPGDFQPVDSVANPTALTPTLVISNVQPSHAGNYKLQAVNQGGSTDSQVATLTVTPDGDGPVAIKAVVSADRTQITISYDEPVLASDGLGNDNAQDPFDYSVHEVGNPGNFLSVQQSPLPALVNRTNIVLVIDPGGPQWVEGTSYEIDIVADIPDECTGVRSLGQTIAVSAPLVFRQGLRGYTGTLDVEVHQATPDTANGEAAGITVDQEDPAPNAAQGLIQFGNIFGSDPTQIPFGSTINSATLTVRDQNDASAINMYRMLVAWDESSTWNSLVNGVQPDGTEADSTALANFTPAGGNVLININVTSSVQLWSDGAPNHGWVFINTAGNGWDFATSEDATDANKPTLTVDFTPAPCTMPMIITHPVASVTIEEGQTLTLSVSASGGCNLRYQWTRNGGDITGATSATYTKVNANPNDNGTYRVRITNDLGSIDSNPSSVTVNADVVRPVLASAVPEADMVTIRLTYSEVMGASAGAVGSYSIPGLSISSATLAADGSNVVLVTSPRTFRQSYTLTITGVRDDAIAGGGNLLNPNPTIVTIRSDVQRIAGFHDNWHYNTNCQDFTGWETTAFDPVLNGWAEGPGSFGVETSAGTQALLASEGAQIQTALLDPSPDGLVSYFRRSITVPSLDMSGGAVFVVRHFADDGIVFFVDGAEAFRTANMTNFPMSCTNLALDTPPGGDANLIEDTVALTPGGTHLLAAQVQQNSGTSSDLVFGAEILAVLPAPRLTITHDAVANTITVSWTPAGGQLEESTNLSAPNQGFGNSLRQNGVAFANPGTTTFYRVRR